MGFFITLISALPEIIQLLRVIQNELANGPATDRKVSDDLITIKEAYAAKDAQKLHDLFNSK